MRHNNLRDAEARFMEEICKDVAIEPVLLPTDEEQTRGNTAERARLDISARGVWGGCEKTFFDVRVCHPNSDSYLNKSMEAIYADHDNHKKKVRVRMNLDDTFFEMSEKMALAYHSCISDKIAYRRMMHIAYMSPNGNVLCTNI